MTREAQLEALVLDILRLPILGTDPAWIKRAEQVITLIPCPGCHQPSPGGELCDTCYHRQASHDNNPE